MSKQITRDEAWELLNEYNKDRFHLKHALTVEGVMKYFSNLHMKRFLFIGKNGHLRPCNRIIES